MTPEILRKLDEQLSAGITTEVQVVYLMAGVRKILEQENLKGAFPELNFHCNWALHAKLDGYKAQVVLKCFDAANTEFKAGFNFHDLPYILRNELESISQMKLFKQQMENFLTQYSLPSLTKHRGDGWSHFLHLYGYVIQDCPLVICRPETETTRIKSVTVSVKVSDEPQDGQIVFIVNWTIQDINGKEGSFFILNSFSSDPELETE